MWRILINKVLVVGGTGRLGRFVVEELLRRKIDVKVGVRRGHKARELWGERVEIVEGDFRKSDVITEGLKDVDVVHINPPSGPRFDEDFENGVALCQEISKFASLFPLRRISLLSGASEISPQHQFPPVRAKALMEEAIKSSGVPWTIWRATWFMEALLNLVRRYFIVQIGRGDIPVRLIAARDFADMAVRSWTLPQCENKILFAMGPELIHYGEALRLMKDILYPRQILIPVPSQWVAFMGRLVGPREAWYGAQLIKYFQSIPEVGDPQETFQLLGTPPTTLRMWLTDLKASSSTHQAVKN
ncbi:MAG: SDR family oxidoreductase [bacterium]